MPISDYLKNLRGRIGHDLLLIPSVAAIIRDDDGRVLFIRQAEGLWSLPAGAIDPGETPAQAIIREAMEETNLRVTPTCIVGVFGGAENFRFKYPNGDKVEFTVIVFECETRGGELRANDGEALELKYFPVDDLPQTTVAYPPEIFSPELQMPYFDRED